MARPTKLTAELQDAIVKRVEAGNYPEVAAASLGIHRSTYYRWMRKGRKQRKGAFCDLCGAIKKAEAVDQLENILHVKKAIKGGQLVERRTITKKDGTTETVEKFSAGQWTAACWLLERKYPHLWALREAKKAGNVHEELKELQKQVHALLAKQEDDPPNPPRPYRSPEPAA